MERSSFEAVIPIINSAFRILFFFAVTHFQTRSRACLKKAFCKMCVTICGRFCPDEGAVAGYGN
ncbi:DUF6783 domain-containing protein [Blautia sp. 210702-DFI.1.159]|uniref:DUF6783 domain-containing protein n=1 Tax=Clostridia TaxID=186801 RepID=UPI003FA45C37